MILYVNLCLIKRTDIHIVRFCLNLFSRCAMRKSTISINLVKTCRKDFFTNTNADSLSQEKFEDTKGVIMNLNRRNTDNAMGKRKRTMSKITLREIFQLILQGG